MNGNSVIPFYILLGIVVGVIFGFCFSTADKKWKRNTVSFIVFPVTFGILYSAKEYFALDNGAIIAPSTSYLCSFFLAFTAVFIAICYLIKTQKAEKVKLRVLDIVLGYSKSLEMYYDSRQKEVNASLRLDELKEATRRNTYTLGKLQEKERLIEEILSKGECITFNLPMNAQHPISNNFIRALPMYVKNYADFCTQLEAITQTHISQYTGSEMSSETLWTAYFVAVCNAINTTLFDTHKSGVRSHVRILTADNYVKVISVKGDSELNQDLTPIPKDQGMIYAACKSRSSLVRSLNPNHHYEAKHDGIWMDYLTFAVDGFEEGGYPLVSMGISVANAEKYQELLYFINYLQIEETISNSIQTVSQACDLNSYILKWREKYGSV